jgi:anti-sigma factor RsiW
VITCDDFLAEFGDYISGHVSPEVREQLESHLSQCRTCQVLYDSTRKTLKIVTDSGSFDLPSDISDQIVDKVMAKLRRVGAAS